MENMICRICHQVSGVALINIFDSLDSEIFISQTSQYLSLKVSENDGLSPLICHLCIFNLNLCNKLSKTYSSSSCSKLAANDCCCICGGILKTVEVDQDIIELLKKAQNCLSYMGDCPLLNDTANKSVCLDCLFMLNEVCQFYSKIHGDVNQENRCSNIAPETKKEPSHVQTEEEEPVMRNNETMIQYGPSTTRRPKKTSHKTCEICKNNVKRKDICKKCEKHAQSVKVALNDILHCEKL